MFNENKARSVGRYINWTDVSSGNSRASSWARARDCGRSPAPQSSPECHWVHATLASSVTHHDGKNKQTGGSEEERGVGHTEQRGHRSPHRRRHHRDRGERHEALVRFGPSSIGETGARKSRQRPRPPPLSSSVHVHRT